MTLESELESTGESEEKGTLKGEAPADLKLQGEINTTRTSRQYHKYSFHCLHAIWICGKYWKAFIYSLDLFILMF